MDNYVRSADNSTREMKIGWFVGGKDDEHNDFGVVATSSIIAMQGKFSFGLMAFDRFSQPELRCNTCLHVYHHAKNMRLL